MKLTNKQKKYLKKHLSEFDKEYVEKNRLFETLMLLIFDNEDIFDKESDWLNDNVDSIKDFLESK